MAAPASQAVQAIPRLSRDPPKLADFMLSQNGLAKAMSLNLQS
jgi:hypothetical protein